MAALPRITVICAAAVVLLTGSACIPTRQPAARPSWNAAPAKLSKEELGELLAQFQDTYEATIRHAANRIVDQQPDRATRRRSLLWQTRLIPMMRDALDQSDALQALVDAWALCLRDQHFFTDGDGRDMFGPDQAIAREATRRSLAAIEQIAAHFLPPETLDRARGAVDELARRHPLRGEFSGTAVRAAVQPVEREADVLATIMRAPMAPFRAFEGIDRGAAAIQGFTAVAARMTDTVQDLPESARLQTQLLVMELEELETIQAALASLQELTRSAARISTVAEQLPENLRRELALAAEDLEARQAQFQQTLRDAQEVAGRVNETLGCVETAAASVERTATHAAMAGDAWTQTVQAVSDLVVSFREPGPAAGAGAPADQAEHVPAPESPGRPVDDPASGPSATAANGFDINEYTQAAIALDRAAASLRQLTDELRGLAGSGELQTALRELEVRTGAVVDASRISAVNVVDHVAWRAGQVVLLFFATLLAYTLLARTMATRLARRPPAASQP
jgi:hypothetical protein